LESGSRWAMAKPYTVTKGGMFGRRGDEVYVIHGPNVLLNGAAARFLVPHWHDYLEPNSRLRAKHVPLDFIDALGSGLNYTEALVYLDLVADGYEVLRGGWPDLLAVRDDALLGVEVKLRGDDLSGRQIAMHSTLRKHGFPVEVRHYH
jgi:hypothetical protein